MTITATASALALLLSLPALLWLAWRDPKRLRSRPASKRGTVTSTALSGSSRRLLAAWLLLPGLGLMVGGWWPAFLIWAGALPALGWLAVLLLASR